MEVTLGEVEVFTVTGQSDVARAYAWAEDVATGSNSTVVLERPPIETALDAFRAALASAAKRAAHNSGLRKQAKAAIIIPWQIS